jgi:hypothetical protein
LTSTERGQLEGQERDEKKIGQKIASGGEYAWRRL